MSDPPRNGRPPLAVLVSGCIAIVTGGAFLFDRAVGVHDAMSGMKSLSSNVDDLNHWRTIMEAQRAERFNQLTNSITKLDGQMNMVTDKLQGVGSQVDAIRQQQVHSAEAVQNTQDDVRAIARVLGTPTKGKHE